MSFTTSRAANADVRSRSPEVCSGIKTSSYFLGDIFREANIAYLAGWTESIREDVAERRAPVE
jgi:hypothetical protein